MIRCLRQGKTITHKFDKENKSNIKDFYCADIHGGRSFLLNDAGYPLNDVDAIIRQQDSDVREAMLSQLAEVPTSGVPSDMPNSEVLLGLKSRYQQAPSELVSFYEKQLEIQASKIEAAQAAAAAAASADKTPSDVVDDV